jgi:hypothetical protein
MTIHQDTLWPISRVKCRKISDACSPYRDGKWLIFDDKKVSPLPITKSIYVKQLQGEDEEKDNTIMIDDGEGLSSNVDGG